MKMNITLSADEQLIRKSREYAAKHHTTLNNLIREYLKKLTVGTDSTTSPAEEFSCMAEQFAGESPVGYRFNREELYNRDQPHE